MNVSKVNLRPIDISTGNPVQNASVNGNPVAGPAGAPLEFEPGKPVHIVVEAPGYKPFEADKVIPPERAGTVIPVPLEPENESGGNHGHGNPVQSGPVRISAHPGGGGMPAGSVRKIPAGAAAKKPGGLPLPIILIIAGGFLLLVLVAGAAYMWGGSLFDGQPATAGESSAPEAPAAEKPAKSSGGGGEVTTEKPSEELASDPYTDSTLDLNDKTFMAVTVLLFLLLATDLSQAIQRGKNPTVLLLSLLGATFLFGAVVLTWISAKPLVVETIPYSFQAYIVVTLLIIGGFLLRDASMPGGALAIITTRWVMMEEKVGFLPALLKVDPNVHTWRFVALDGLFTHRMDGEMTWSLAIYGCFVVALMLVWKDIIRHRAAIPAAVGGLSTMIIWILPYFGVSWLYTLGGMFALALVGRFVLSDEDQYDEGLMAGIIAGLFLNLVVPL